MGLILKAIFGLAIVQGVFGKVDAEMKMPVGMVDEVKWPEILGDRKESQERVDEALPANGITLSLTSPGPGSSSSGSPTVVPWPECPDTTECNNAHGGLGTCFAVVNPNLQRLQDFDLTAPALKGLCQSSVSDSGVCCSCMKKKTSSVCSDTGCSSQFGGQGVCVNMVSGGVANYDLDLTVEPDNSPELCNNTVNSDCCTCFKSALGGTETTTTTIPTTTTTLGPPCEDKWPEKKCKKCNAKKCKKDKNCKKNCQKTCDLCDDRSLSFDPFY